MKKTLRFAQSDGSTQVILKPDTVGMKNLKFFKYKTHPISPNSLSFD